MTATRTRRTAGPRPKGRAPRLVVEAGLVDEVAGSAERFFPGRLPGILPAFLAGESVAEPFEWWN